MDKINYAFLQLRLKLLESVLLQDLSARAVYTQELTLLKKIVESQAEPESDKLLSLIDEHLAYINSLPAKK